jgi:CDP-diacylglycerol--glycerol-3-phosphate 3-phosphatidyltransferase
MGKVKTVGQFGLVAVALYPPAPWQATVVILSGAVVTVISIMSGVQYLALSLYAKDPSWLAGKPRLGAPNWISAFRLALALIVPYIFIAGPFGEWSFAVGVIVGTVACLTDAVDGFIARMWRLKTDFGKIFDPIADKAAQYLLALGLIAAEWTIVPWWLALLAGVCLVGRDIACLTWFVLMQERIGAGWCDKLRSVAVVAWLGSLAWVGFTGEQVDLSNGILLFAAVASVISLFADWRRIEKK